ncbi:MAG: FAD:protein FMN transferase [Verrucomicrobiota bacterium]|jgi:thiamine biosynthesis lipoprotein|nr:FAD:protein FMN transferase [Verrucomicrobiota bacterium]MDP6753684.1 FAD:protein FMN transferase [Verrucomicrobiota bacterium]MDP7013409.1 FAD:protein FMN transferase [Verrucomicrobiota bacterium]
MPLKPQGERVVDTGARSIADAHHFAHEAMATVFELYIVSEDEAYARGGAQAAFAEVDRLELEMSRFIENSDIARLNSALPGEIVEVGMEVFDCLTRAVEMYEQTGGAFDITVGALYECWLNDDRTVRRPSEAEVERARELTGMNHLKLDTESFGVEVLAEGLQVDLGGIGKGFAAEKVADILREWSLGQALVLAGASSVLSVSVPDGMSGWPMRLSNPSKPGEILARFELTEGALSGSGRQKGQHIIDPREAAVGPVEGRLAAWSMAPDAVAADASSTAFMVLEPQEIDDYCLANRQTAAIILPHAVSGESQRPEVMQFGQWNQIDTRNDS